MTDFHSEKLKNLLSSIDFEIYHSYLEFEKELKISERILAKAQAKTHKHMDEHEIKLIQGGHLSYYYTIKNIEVPGRYRESKVPEDKQVLFKEFKEYEDEVNKLFSDTYKEYMKQIIKNYNNFKEHLELKKVKMINKPIKKTFIK